MAGRDREAAEFVIQPNRAPAGTAGGLTEPTGGQRQTPGSGRMPIPDAKDYGDGGLAMRVACRCQSRQPCCSRFHTKLNSRLMGAFAAPRAATDITTVPV